MNALMKLQIKTIFTSPVPYLLVFIVIPVLYILSSAFLPAMIVLPGIIITIIFSMTFFVFGNALFQAKNSIVFKRLTVVGISKPKFIFGNALLSIMLSMISVYIFIEMFATIVGIKNFEILRYSFDEFFAYDKYDISLLVPMSYNWFFLNDLFNTLDDASWLLLTDGVYWLSTNVYIIPTELLSDKIHGLAQTVDDMTEIEFRAIVASINVILEILEINKEINWEKDPTVVWIHELADEVATGNGPVIDWLSNRLDQIGDALSESYINNGEHAPIGLITQILLPSVEDHPGFAYPILWDENDNVAQFRSNKWYTFRIYRKGEVDGAEIGVLLLYTRIAPTFSSIMSPAINYDSPIKPISHYANENLSTMIGTWLKYFSCFFVSSFVIYSLMLLFVSISNSFEQYSLLSGLSLVIVFIFSGLVLPFVLVLSLPSLFLFASIIPTTPLIFEMQHLWFQNPEISILAQPYQNLIWSLLYPTLVSFLFLIIATRLLSSENGKLTKKFTHDDRSYRASTANIFVNSLVIILLFIWYYTLVNFRVDNHDLIDTSAYPSNLHMFIPILLIVVYSLLLFTNAIFLSGRSITFYKYKKQISWLNALILFPVGIFTLIFSYNSLTNIKTN